MEEFEEIIRKDVHLSKLLNDKTITVFSNFSRNEYSDALKESFQEKYYQVFKELYERSFAEKDVATSSALMRSIEFLAAETTKQRIAEEVFPQIVEVHEALLGFKEELHDGNGFVVLTGRFNFILDGSTIAILNNLDAFERIQEYKVKIISAALGICDAVGKVNPKKEPFKFDLHHAVIDKLAQINDFGALQERFELHKTKLTKKQTKVEVKYVVGAIIVILLILLRLLSRLDRSF